MLPPILRTAILSALGGLLATAALGQAPTATAPAEAPPTPPKNLIKIAPLGWIHGQLPFSVESRVGYERVISPSSSVGASYSYLGTNYPFSFLGSVALSTAISTAFTASGHPAIVWTATRIRTTGHRYQLQYRFYPGRRQAPEGLYLAPNFSHAEARYDISLKDYPEVAIGIKAKRQNYSLLVGFQEVIGRHFVVDVFGGLGYRRNTTELYAANGRYLETMPRGTKLKLNSGFNIGWAF